MKGWRKAEGAASQGRGEGAEEQSGVAGVLSAMRVAARDEVRET